MCHKCAVNKRVIDKWKEDWADCVNLDLKKAFDHKMGSDPIMKAKEWKDLRIVNQINLSPEKHIDKSRKDSQAINKHQSGII